MVARHVISEQLTSLQDPWATMGRKLDAIGAVHRM
jgi:hypothetical protein